MALTVVIEVFIRRFHDPEIRVILCAFWKMYGLDLPHEVLKKLYYKNALRIIPSIDPTPFPK